jgi:hypothetical protein
MSPREAPGMAFIAILPVAPFQRLDHVTPARQAPGPPLLEHMVVLVEDELRIAEERVGIPTQEDHAGTRRRGAAPVQARVNRPRDYADLARLRPEEPLEFGRELRRWFDICGSEDWHTSQR